MTPSINTPAFPEEEVETSLPGQPLFYVSKIKHAQKFPMNSRGFLYYYVPPGQSPIAGELRFRVTPTSNPASFDEGHNLTTLNGFYWRMQFHAMPEALRNLALRDQPITPTVDTEHILEVDARTPALHYLEQPFFFKFEHAYITIACIHNGDVQRIRFYNPTRDSRESLNPGTHNGGIGITPYRGMYGNLTLCMSSK